jgi:hypothetical protein
VTKSQASNFCKVLAKAKTALRSNVKPTHKLPKIDLPDKHAVHPLMRQYTRSLMKELQKLRMDMKIFEMHRSFEKQEEYYARGASKARYGQSPHNWGMAVDIIDRRRGWDLSENEWAIFGAIVKSVSEKTRIPVDWGGDWKFYDPAHIQLRHWKQYRDQLTDFSAGVPDNIGEDFYTPDFIQYMEQNAPHLEWVRYRKSPKTQSHMIL